MRQASWGWTGLALAVGLGSSPALAQDAETEALVEVHGFVSQGAIKTTKNNYLTANSKRGSFEFTEVGLNVSKQLTEKLRVGLQLFAYELGPLGNYEPRFDWYYLDYRFRDFLGLRAGRTKIPFGLYNDSADIDAARVPVLLPQSVYPVNNRDYLLAQTGGELYGNVKVGAGGALEYRAYGGTLDLKAPQSSAGITIEDIDVPYVVGGRLMWLTPLDGLSVGASYQALRFDWTYNIEPAVVSLLQMQGVLPADFMGTLPVELRVKLWVASAEYQAGDLLVAAEYSRWIANLKSKVPTLLPEDTTNERYYVMGSYRVTPWFTPGAYYSGYYANVDERHGRAAYQHDVAGTLRFDVNQYWLVKLEGHWMHGTAALDSSLNDDKPLSELALNWGAFLLKTTAYF
jgi:hypothetical protein